MLDIKFIRENKVKVKQAAINKKIDVDLDKLLELDSTYKNLLVDVQRLREERNLNTKSLSSVPSKEQIEKGKDLKEALEKAESALKKVKENFDALLKIVPNIPDKSVPIGRGEEDNVAIRKWGEIKKFQFKVKDHLSLGESLDIIDTKSAAEISG